MLRLLPPTRRRPRAVTTLLVSFANRQQRPSTLLSPLFSFSSSSSSLAENDGLILVRTQSHLHKGSSSTTNPTTLKEVLKEAQASWQKYHAHKPAFQVLHIHDQQKLKLLLQDCDAADQNIPTLGVTARRSLDMDEKEEKESKEGEGNLTNTQQTWLATCISVGLPKNAEEKEVVIFRAADASFPLIQRKNNNIKADTQSPSTALQAMVEGQQPRLILFFAPPLFPLQELASRLELIFNKAHVLAAYSRPVPSNSFADDEAGSGGIPASSIFALEGNGKEEKEEREGERKGGEEAAVGLALFGAEDVTTAQIGRIACSILGSSWVGAFTLDTPLTQHLFVPRNFVLGTQRRCEKYQMVEETEAKQLPLFRFNSVLFPGCSMILRIFEPRYRMMIKNCLEKNEPFGFINADIGVGTMAVVTEVYSMQEDTGISIIKVLGTRRFEVEGGLTHVEPDSFGLLHAEHAKFLEEDPCVNKEELAELESLHLQAKACLELTTASTAGGVAGGGADLSAGPLSPFFGREKEKEKYNAPEVIAPGVGIGGDSWVQGRTSSSPYVLESFVLSQWLLEHFPNVLSEDQKVRLLHTTSTKERLSRCLDLLLRVVRRRTQLGVDKRK